MILRAFGSVIIVVLFVAGGYAVATRVNPNPDHRVGDEVDVLNGVSVYFNGGVNTTMGRNLTDDGYNLGLRYQCVEFVKRYLFERHRHRMPDTYGHARDYFDPSVPDGGWNEQRAMVQFTNGSSSAPEPDDVLVFEPSILNPYGHVAIVSAVEGASVELVQQNPGPFGQSRERFLLVFFEGRWVVKHSRVLGWLRLPGERD